MHIGRTRDRKVCAAIVRRVCDRTIHVVLSMRRLPALLYRMRCLCIAAVVCVLLLTYLLLHWGVVCSNVEAWGYVTRICHQHKEGLGTGNLCAPLCNHKQKSIHSVKCHSFHLGKEAVFSAEWTNSRIVFKAAQTLNDKAESLYWLDSNKRKHYPTEKEFQTMVRDVVGNKLNVSVSSEQMKGLIRLVTGRIEQNADKRHLEMDNLWTLLQDNEYLSTKIYSERDIFPQIIGTCGNFFAVEYLEPVESTNILTLTDDSKEEWGQRLKLAILIMEFVEELDINFPEPFSLCDIKLEHFAYARGGERLKFIDIDTVYPKTIINRMTSDGSQCNHDSDCDYFDCRSRCNKDLHKCDEGVTNNNLQIICEKIFLGWTLSNTLIVPGLLMTVHTPSSLSVILRQCANPHNELGRPRGGASEATKRKLYNILLEMEQVVNNEVSLDN